MFEPARLKTKQTDRNVTVELRDGRKVSGTLAMRPGQSVNTLIDGSSPFLSVSTADGEVAFHRDFIAAVMIDEDRAEHDDDAVVGSIGSAGDEGTFDPCRILQVQPGASEDELKAAWRTRMRACHPDSVRGRGYADDIVQAAQRQAQLVNKAYETLVGLRRKA